MNNTHEGVVCLFSNAVVSSPLSTKQTRTTRQARSKAKPTGPPENSGDGGAADGPRRSCGSVAHQLTLQETKDVKCDNQYWPGMLLHSTSLPHNGWRVCISCADACTSHRTAAYPHEPGSVLP